MRYRGTGFGWCVGGVSVCVAAQKFSESFLGGMLVFGKSAVRIHGYTSEFGERVSVRLWGAGLKGR